jgi:hypothetical protein
MGYISVLFIWWILYVISVVHQPCWAVSVHVDFPGSPKSSITKMLPEIYYFVGRIVTRVYIRHTMSVRIMSGMFRTGH